jgi:hypothetical protein
MTVAAAIAGALDKQLGTPLYALCCTRCSAQHIALCSDWELPASWTPSDDQLLATTLCFV